VTIVELPRHDVPDGSDAPEDDFAPARVQSSGDIVQQIAKFYPGGIADSQADLQAVQARGSTRRADK
jgi:hypothetical protein